MAIMLLQINCMSSIPLDVLRLNANLCFSSGISQVGFNTQVRGILSVPLSSLGHSN